MVPLTLSPFSFLPSSFESEKWKWSHSVAFDYLQTHGLYSPWNSPGQNTGVDSLSLLQGIFPTQGSNPGLLHCRQILYQLSHKGSPRILEWVPYPFSSWSSWPRNQTSVSCIAGRFFTNWAIREELFIWETSQFGFYGHHLPYSLPGLPLGGLEAICSWVSEWFSLSCT